VFLSNVQAEIYAFPVLGSRHLGSRLPVTWDRGQCITCEKHVVENIGFGFGMVFGVSI